MTGSPIWLPSSKLCLPECFFFFWSCNANQKCKQHSVIITAVDWTLCSIFLNIICFYLPSNQRDGISSTWKTVELCTSYNDLHPKIWSHRSSRSSSVFLFVEVSSAWWNNKVNSHLWYFKLLYKIKKLKKACLDMLQCQFHIYVAKATKLMFK